MLLFVLSVSEAVLFLTGCPPQRTASTSGTTGQPADDTKQPQASEPSEPFKVDIQLAQVMEPMLTDEPVRPPTGESAPQTAPEDLLVSLSVENPLVQEGTTYDVDFVYQALAYRGIRTFLSSDPKDPNSGYVSDENGPISYYVLEPVEGRIENPDLTGDQDLSFYIVPPEGTYAIRYWTEIRIKKGDGETDYAKVPWVTVDEALERGGNLVIPEDGRQSTQ